MAQAIFRKILVPVDLSEKGRSALEWASRMCGPETAITLLHVVETLEDVPFEEMEDFYRKLEERAVETLDRWLAELEGEGVLAERRVVFGHRLEEILGFAGREAPDLILLRSHPLDTEAPTRGWATLSYRVAVLAPCPVLLVK